MSGPDGLNGLVGELRALPARHRRMVMKALTRSERSRIEKLLAPPRAEAPEPDPDEQLIAGYSALIGGRVRCARGDSALSRNGWNMTPAARRQLLLSAHEIQEADRIREKEKLRPRGRSLLDALGSWLASGAGSR